MWTFVTFYQSFNCFILFEFDFFVKLTQQIECYIVTLRRKRNGKIIDIEYASSLKQKLNCKSKPPLHDKNLNDLFTVLSCLDKLLVSI